MPEHRFEQHHEGEQRQETQGEQKKGLEFATAEEAIRHDRENTVPPPEIAERLNQSLANEPKKETSFWARITGRE
jgi:hypothetical protein